MHLGPGGDGARVGIGGIGSSCRVDEAKGLLLGAANGLLGPEGEVGGRTSSIQYSPLRRALVQTSWPWRRNETDVQP